MADLVLDIAIPGSPSFRVPVRATTTPMLLGRSEDSDLVIPSPYVSRHHARLGAGNGSWWVEDAGSSAGLLLNGNIVTRRCPLHGGDLLRLGDVDIVVSLPPGAGGYAPPGQSSGYHVDRPQAGTINMVEGVQYNIQPRESFAREIAATRSKATTLVVIGFLMLCGGSVVFMAPLLDFMNQFGSVSPEETITNGGFYGPKVGGVSVGLIGFAIGFIGQFVLIAGIVLHIVAAARRRKLNRMPNPGSH